MWFEELDDGVVVPQWGAATIMSWDFETDPEFQRELDWVDDFVRDEVEPVDQVIEHAWDMDDPVRQALIPPLQEQVRERGLWACHLGPHLGGPGYGQVKLALLNEILGRSHSGPIVFGCQAPDSGNAEILAHYGTDELKKRYLEPLLRNEIVSAFSMTEPRGGSDPTRFVDPGRARRRRVGDQRREVVLVRTPTSPRSSSCSRSPIPTSERHRRMSMFVVPADTPGVEIVRNVGVYGHRRATARTATSATATCASRPTTCSASRGEGFVVAQTRLGGGRIHHAMRTVGLVKQALDRCASGRCRASRRARCWPASSSCRR